MDRKQDEKYQLSFVTQRRREELFGHFDWPWFYLSPFLRGVFQVCLLFVGLFAALQSDQCSADINAVLMYAVLDTV